tara:strand:+ start:200 stop:913 length:714 start_codon:yes stop_codon:yes gene_type:complete
MTIRKKIIKHAKDEFPNECCGFLIQKTNGMTVFPCINSSVLKNKHFKISAKEYLKASFLGEIVSVYHSHVSDNDDFSEHDKTQSENQNLRYLLYHIKTKKFKEYIPKGKKTGLVGRSYETGVRDCFSLCIDYYKTEHGIEISEHWKNYSFLATHSNTKLFEENFEKEDFFKISKEEIRKGDGLIINRYGDDFTSHSAIYMGNDCILHHPAYNFSCIEKYSSFLKKKTLFALRHNKLK